MSSALLLLSFYLKSGLLSSSGYDVPVYCWSERTLQKANRQSRNQELLLLCVNLLTPNSLVCEHQVKYIIWWIQNSNFKSTATKRQKINLERIWRVSLWMLSQNWLPHLSFAQMNYLCPRCCAGVTNQMHSRGCGSCELMWWNVALH